MTGSAVLVALVASLAPAVTGGGGATANPGTEPLVTAASTPDGAVRPAPEDAERTRLVALDGEQLARARAGDRIALDLFDDTALTAVLDQRTDEGGTTAWTGHLEGTPGSFTGVEVDGTHHLHVATATDTYEVTLAGADTYRVTESGPAPHGDGDDDVDLPPRKPGAPAGAQADQPDVNGQDPADQVDVAVVYPAALATQSGASALQAQINLAVTQSNQAFANSGLAVRLRLVGTRQVASTVTGDILDLIGYLRTPGDGIYDEAQALREETHADLVSLWVPPSMTVGTTCGRGGLGGYHPPSQAESAAWTVIRADCATDNLTFTHEIGHNLSAHHDATASYSPTEGKPYARGFVDLEARTITVMAYYNSCTEAGVYCTRIPYFSSPSVRTTGGRVTGTPAADNVRAIAEQAPAVANYRQSRIYPGTVQITGAARAGQGLQAVPAGWAPGNVSFGYQWLVDGVPVPGATGATYVPAPDLVGRAVSVHVTASAPYYSPVTAGSAPVGLGKALFGTSKPRIKGKARPGRKLKARLKGWSPKPSSARYQWFRNGKKIKGARKATYKVKRRDRGKKLHVVVRATRDGYEDAKARSRKVKVRR